MRYFVQGYSLRIEQLKLDPTGASDISIVIKVCMYMYKKAKRVSCQNLIDSFIGQQVLKGFLTPVPTQRASVIRIMPPFRYPKPRKETRSNYNNSMLVGT